DPVELALELIGAEAHRPEHAHAPRLADRGDHVAAVGEGEDRVLDAEHVTQVGVHGSPRCRRCTRRYVARSGRAETTPTVERPGAERPLGGLLAAADNES